MARRGSKKEGRRCVEEGQLRARMGTKIAANSTIPRCGLTLKSMVVRREKRCGHPVMATLAQTIPPLESRLGSVCETNFVLGVGKIHNPTKKAPIRFCTLTVHLRLTSTSKTKLSNPRTWYYILGLDSGLSRLQLKDSDNKSDRTRSGIRHARKPAPDLFHKWGLVRTCLGEEEWNTGATSIYFRDAGALSRSFVLTQYIAHIHASMWSLASGALVRANGSISGISPSSCWFRAPRPLTSSNRRAWPQSVPSSICSHMIAVQGISRFPVREVQLNYCHRDIFLDWRYRSHLSALGHMVPKFSASTAESRYPTATLCSASLEFWLPGFGFDYNPSLHPGLASPGLEPSWLAPESRCLHWLPSPGRILEGTNFVGKIVVTW
ncbi:hypothetical protein DFH07DRAFT_784814 [Mycena maculata]|uniref:Uncharacterized protein n=1 Tax=Mycena maculata TaxID=230809 RepID=A0AAD7HEA7_9AGAR|nr:hypothetical protein DFH07DRAFT_784814 [Mycena maculata]